MKKKTYANQDLKKFMKENQVSYFDLGQKVGVTGDTIYRRFRGELSKEDKRTYLAKVKEIISERGD